MDAATALPNDHATVARDYTRDSRNGPIKDTESRSVASENGFIASVSRAYPAHFAKLTSAIRNRHYSIRTEQSYSAWLARYI